MADDKDNIILDQSVMNGSIMRLIQECCEIMNDTAMGNSSFYGIGWTVEFKKDDQNKSELQ